MAAHALTLTQQILQMVERGADNASLAQRLDEALSFAPGYDLGGGLSSERWSTLYALAHGERDDGWRPRLVAALWEVYDEALWLEPFPTLEQLQRAKAANGGGDPIAGYQALEARGEAPARRAPRHYDLPPRQS
jgi:hypothetical protein